jgi:2-oxoisovalerate dehydrogenase E1 component beta subunit
MAPVTYLEAIRQCLAEEMERDPSVVLIGEDIGVYGGAFQATAGLLERFGWERVIDTPISETAIVGAAVGMSYLGLRPVVEMQFMDFIACAFNSVTNYAANSHYLLGEPVPIVIRGPSGGGVHGGPFHSSNSEMHFVHTPGLKVVCPATASDAKGLLKSAIRDNNPVLFFEHKFLYRRIKEDLSQSGDGSDAVPLGKALVRRPGRDLSIVSYAAMVHASLQAAETLAQEGIEAEVVDLRTLAPLDRTTIFESVRRTSKLLVVHEDVRTGGIAGEIAALVTESLFGELDGPIRRVTGLDTPVPFSPPLEEYFLPSAEKIAVAARELARY